ncbi:LysM peptidoglycan-binding domain-containing protein [Candidatus Sulfidibacterium hydrothermale]|uniref:lytic transglycosylase domain-containing protein n=1 Tax=Candidatus Sulfidibacterium hydrothermale TaxID=2875962 RepID=UPI001F0AE920|nr:lytic transglycosylase domain-containing protein [Candidatus Sulfidibacterium hydrothermale]UBM62799.1 LysM peptidoglycan-binding domain-containing protein [Candidatus Sulfidibacterium hydrothermale]
MKKDIFIIVAILFFTTGTFSAKGQIFKHKKKKKSKQTEQQQDTVAATTAADTVFAFSPAQDTVAVTADTLMNEDSLEKDLPSFQDSIFLPRTLGALNRINDSIHRTREFHGHTLISDSPLVQALDSLAYVKFYRKGFLMMDTVLMKKSKFKPGQIPEYPDSVYAKRIAALNAETPIELVYNKQVKAFIHLYADKRRKLTEKVLGLSELYFPMIEQVLDQFNLPLELKYLAVVESALNPAAGSNKGAKGLWQFMYGTGKVYGLKVTSLVDDRYDPYKSTIAACEHLKDLYAIYGNWSLVLAAYNSGAGNVNRAIRRAGGTKNYWAIWPFLPRETRGYVPAFIAVNYIMHYAPQHNLYPMRPGIFYFDIDTVTVHDALSFDQLHEMLGIPLDELKFLNPEYKLGIIPAVNGKTYTLRLPRQFADDFLNNEKALYAFKTKKGLEHDKMLAEIKKAGNRNVVIVRYGDNLGSIARRNHVYVSQLMRWNGLHSTRIYPGQRLVVYGAGSRQFYQKTASPIARSSKKVVHVVRRGENLGLIAKKYRCTPTDLKEWNNLKSSRIYPGQKLYVYKPAEKSKTTVRSGKYIYHIVKPGDTLWDIAKEYDGVTVEQIKRLNHIRNSHHLRPGQRIKIASVS